MQRNDSARSFIINFIVPSIVFGFVTGTLTALVVNLYKLCAKHVIEVSEMGYEYLRGHLYFLPLVILALFGISLLFAFIYKKIPNIKGGGIPTSIAILRDLVTFKWLRNLLGVFVMSLVTFLIGVPLGNEGPAVQMGTSIGRGSVYILARRHTAWDRYSMTGGACSGFYVATGAPISGILFAIEEAHQRISPTIMIVASSSVVFSSIANQIFAPWLGVSTQLFDVAPMSALELKQLWVPLVVGLAIGIFGVLLLNYYKLLSKFFSKRLAGVKPQYKIFAILTVTVIMGLVSFSNVSTGHELIHQIFAGSVPITLLILVLIVRSTLTLSANKNGITGGMFIPTLALGAIVASIVGKIVLSLGGGEELYGIIIILGITATMSGVMKTPLTAIVFAIEALSCYENILAIVIVAILSYFVTELFETTSINDTAMEGKIEELNRGKEAKIVKEQVEVMAGAFAVGKQIRDIFWPANLFVLSVKKASAKSQEVDGHGGKLLHAGDILQIQYSTNDENETKRVIEAIVGKQKPKAGE
ncbi:MAG: chloride channel protein [Clostridia bacterium]|nr:chloride channel protein [Clostridia bacterium]